MANDSKKYVSLTRLSNFLDNIKAKYSQIGHKHTMSDLTDYKVDTTLSSTSNNPIANKTVDAEFDAIATAMGALDLAIDGKADASHTHDDRYYTESEIDTKLASKANSSHNHDSAYDAKGSASTVQENLDAVSDTLDAHTANSNIHFTAAERTKLSGIAAGAQVNTVTGVKGNSESTYRTGNINITKANIGLGNVDNTADANKSVKHATSADSATSATKATQDGNGKVISSTYETKSDASAKLTEAKTYADNAASAVKNDLLNGAGTAYDTLKELGDLIDDNTDAIGALETVAAGKADKTHSHAIADVSGLQSALDGKAASSHGTHVSYSTTTPVMDGTASVGSASTVARSDHKHPTDTSRAAKTDLDSHTSNTTAHITSTERSNWNAAKSHADSAHAPSNAQANQNAFSNIKVGSTTIAADTTTDTLELVGSNVTITPDATNDKVTIAVASGSTSTAGILKLTNSTSSTSTTTAATPSSVKSAYDLANTAKTNAATAQTRADSAYTLAESKVDSLSDLGITATATELNYMDGVTSNVQTQLDGKAGKKVEGQTITVGDVAYVGGVNAEIFNDYEANIATGAYSHAEGCYNKASGDYSHAEGAATISSGYAGHAEGYQTNASGSASHAEGKNTAAIGQCTHAEGSGSTAVPNTITSSSSISTVETAWNSAKFTLARGTGSHAEGGNTLALNTADHSEGYETIAKGGYSHAQGYKTQATGGRAHAEGQGSKASGNDSHAEGTYTIAAGASQHAQGKYNVEDAAGKYAHIVGGGSSTSKRANIHTLDWDGNAWFEGDIYIGGTGQDDTAASKVVTERYVEEAVTNLDGYIYAEEFDSEATMVPLNADTLGGHPVEDFLRPKAGFIYPLAGQVVPEGFLLCDGAAYSRTEYVELFTAIGTIYGEGDGSTTFNVPNLQTRVPVGAGSGYELGATGGEAEHTLTVDEMPSHKHESWDGGINWVDANATGERASGYAQPSMNAATNPLIITSSTGGSQSHNNMQPYTVVNYIIATGKDTGVSVSDVVLGAQAIPLGVEYGGTGATNAETVRQNLGITPENIGAMSMELLWENASPTSAFAAQQISINGIGDRNAYPLVLVITKNGSVFFDNEVGNWKIAFFAEVQTSAVYFHSRGFTIPSVGTLNVGVNREANKSMTISEANAQNQPWYVYGIKGVPA